MSKRRRKPVDSEPNLRDQACRHELALLNVAETSQQAAIREYALASAKQVRKELRKHDAKISPRTALAFCLFTWIAFAVVCRYSVLHLSWQKAVSVAFFVFVACGALTLVCLTVSKHLDSGTVPNFLQKIADKFPSLGKSSDDESDDSSKGKPDTED
jgi:hypothetical protein